jgi:tetratricopeptide (TPR) repeat protein
MSARVSVPQLRDTALRALARGAIDKALEAFLELEQREPSEPSWPLRVAQCYRRLERMDERIEALVRAVDRYDSAGLHLKALAICKMILAEVPDHGTILERVEVLQQVRPRGLARFLPTPAVRPAGRIRP